MNNTSFSFQDQIVGMLEHLMDLLSYFLCLTSWRKPLTVIMNVSGTIDTLLNYSSCQHSLTTQHFTISFVLLR